MINYTIIQIIQCKFMHHPTQVISASKFIMRKESTHDHVDLLLSSKHWPLAYAVDMACDIVAHTEVRNPSLAKTLWGERRGCFEKPKKEIPHVNEINAA